MSPNPRLLIIYCAMEYPPRATFISHLYSFMRNGCDTVYLNLQFFSFSWPLKYLQFDAIIFHHSVTAPWNEKRYLKRIRKIKKMIARLESCTRIAFFQDEYHRTNLLCRFINELNVNAVCSVAGENEWKKIYKHVDFASVEFYKVLTGYIDDDDVRSSQIYNNQDRAISVGYITFWDQPYKLGRFGFLKYEIARRFSLALERANVHHEIHCGGKFFQGKDWLDFLSSCQFTIGVESGSSLLDEDGSIDVSIRAYLSQKQGKSPTFEEVESACFSGLDNNLALKAISPRHFEACLTRTCQILVEGEYSGILKEDIHYIPLKADLSNLDIIINGIIDGTLPAREVAERAYCDIVGSGLYTYSKFVLEIVAIIAQRKQQRVDNSDVIDKSLGIRLVIYWLYRQMDRVNWMLAKILFPVRIVIKRVILSVGV